MAHMVNLKIIWRMNASNRETIPSWNPRHLEIGKIYHPIGCCSYREWRDSFSQLSRFLAWSFLTAKRRCTPCVQCWIERTSQVQSSQPQPSISLCKCFTCSGLDSKGWRAACKVRRLGWKDSLVIAYPTYGPPKSNRSSTKPFLGGEEIEEIIYIFSFGWKKKWSFSPHRL